MAAEGSGKATAHAAVTAECIVDAGDWADADELSRLAARAVETAAGMTEPPASGLATVVLSDDANVRILNAQWRDKDRPTNVLSFPAGPLPPSFEGPVPLGDIVLARETLDREAAEEGKALADHFAHLVVHGFLHLVGYDHETDEEAEEMEALERRILHRLAIDDPYA